MKVSPLVLRWNLAFSHFRPNFSSETTNFEQMVSKKLPKMSWFQWNCRVVSKKLPKLEMVSMKPSNNCYFQNVPTTMPFWLQSIVNKTTKNRTRKKKNDHILEILVIMARKIVFRKKFVRMIMKMDVLKSGFKAKKALYEIWDTLLKTCLVDTHLSMTAMVTKFR